jgi:hypothetical protein
MRTLHFTPFSTLGTDPPNAGEVSQVLRIATDRLAKVKALAAQRAARESARERIFLADVPLRVSMRDRDVL